MSAQLGPWSARSSTATWRGSTAWRSTASTSLDWSPPEHALAGLLHDAAEAYVAAVSTPVKHSPAITAYRVIEDRIQRVVFEKFGLPPEIPKAVHVADKILVCAEATELFRSPPWTAERKSAPFPITGLEPRAAEKLYLERFKELTC